LDVLQNYIHYELALRIGTADKDKRVDEKSGKRALAKWLSLNPTNIERKTEIAVEHFRTKVAHLLGSKSKAMIVAPSRAAAVKYKLELERYCKAKEYGGIHALVAFSGDVKNKELNESGYAETHLFNESNMNPGLKGRDLRKVFDTQEYQLLIVANKFQTGFDQPKLVAMYLDKKVSGVEAVQTLSRLNRIYPGKDNPFVIDFVNKPEEILAAFKMFYRDAQVSDVQNPAIVYDIKQRLDGMLLYTSAEVVAFGAAIVDKPTHQKLYALTQPATNRFNAEFKELDEVIRKWEKAYLEAKAIGDELGMKQADAQRAEYAKALDELMIFKESLTKFVRVYEYVAQLVDFGDTALEEFASFARLLRKRLQGIAPEQVDLEGLKLTHYKLNKDKTLTGIGDDGKPYTVQPITDNGLREAHDLWKKYISELIERLNHLFGKDISDKDKVAFAIHVAEKLRDDSQVMAQVQNNPFIQTLEGNLPKAAIKAIVEAMVTHKQMAEKLLSVDDDTREIFMSVLYDMLKQDVSADLLRAVRE